MVGHYFTKLSNGSLKSLRLEATILLYGYHNRLWRVKHFKPDVAEPSLAPHTNPTLCP